MSISTYANKLLKIANDNSPLILTAIGVTGTVTTAYLTGKASFKAARLIDAEEPIVTNADPDGEPLSFREKAKLTWKLYLPAAGTGVMTVTCIVLANRIGTRRAAALAAAYTISEKAFVEYRDKVVEKIGEKKAQEVHDEVMADRVKNNPPNKEVIVSGIGEVLCLDSLSGRYFNCDMETLRRAENDINHHVLNNDYATVSQFYEKIGLEPTTISDEMGWQTPDKMLDLKFTSTLADGRPVLVVDYTSIPTREPWSNFRI